MNNIILKTRVDDPLVLVLWVGPTAILGAIKQNFTDLQVKDTFKKTFITPFFRSWPWP